MQELFATGRIVDLVLIGVVLQVAGLLWWRRRTGKGIAPLDLIASVLAGVFLFLALRAALTGAPWTGIAPFLLAALAAHLWDLSRRWR